MKLRTLSLATLLALILIVGISSASTQVPAAGNWAGKFSGVKPATALTFVVSGSGHTRAVTSFQSSGAFKAPCANTEPITVGGIPNATVKAGKFKAVGTSDSAFGEESWTLSGAFKSTHAASGTVAVVLYPAPNKPCKFTLKWTAGVEVAVAPAAGATYTGKAVSSGEAVTLHVSANGKELSSITWHPPLIGGTCPGQGDEVLTLTGKNVPIQSGKFIYSEHTGKISGGHGETTTETITGEFLTGHQASGTISTSADLAGFGTVCVGNDTWTAHG